MATTKEISSLETISGNSALLLGKTAIGNVGFIQGVLAADGKVTGLAEVEGRLDKLEAVTIDQVFDKDSEKAHSGKAVEDAFKKHSTLQGDTGTAYMANELTGGLIKFTTTAGDAGKVTTYDASDSEHTLVQIEANNSDKSKVARINFTADGAFYSKDPSGTAVAVADNELATKGDIKKFQEDDPVFQAHIQDTTVHTTAEEKTAFADKYTKAETDAALALKADQSAVDAALELKADKTAVEAALELKADKTTVAEQLALKADKDAFEAHANDLTKHLGTIKGAKGDALIFNEGDGGGVRFTNTDGSGSLIAVNDGTDNVYAQFSAHTKDKAKITRLNANPDGIYYTKNAADNTVTTDNEIVTKEDIAPLATKQSVTELDARVQVLEAVEVDQTYKPQSTNAQSGTAVAEAIAPLAVKATVDAALAKKADQSSVDTALAAKADASALTSGLAEKAAQTDLEALQATVTALQAKVTELETKVNASA